MPHHNETPDGTDTQVDPAILYRQKQQLEETRRKVIRFVIVTDLLFFAAIAWYVLGRG